MNLGRISGLVGGLRVSLRRSAGCVFSLALIGACSGERANFQNDESAKTDELDAGGGKEHERDDDKPDAATESETVDEPDVTASAPSASETVEVPSASSSQTTTAPTESAAVSNSGGAGGTPEQMPAETGGAGGTGATSDGPVCGNGALEDGEACDDSGTEPGDGCAADCQAELGWDCAEGECQAICGDGLLVDAESEPGSCDDGDPSADDEADGCVACAVSEGWDCAGEPSVCEDRDECATDNGGCGELVTCSNTPGGFTCGDCPQGYTEDAGGDCVDVDECDTDNGGCDDLVMCTNIDGGRTCGECPAGYQGDGAVACADVDECDSNNGGCDELVTCTNTDGGRTCGDCPVGYSGEGDVGCTDVNECVDANGGCDPLVNCTNATPGRICGPCPAGYAGDGVIGCEDVDECETNNGDCDPLTLCTNTVGARTCGACPAGYDGDGVAGCEVCLSSADELKLWEVHLGQSDFVTLKNNTACSIQLEDLEVIFDDRDDAFNDPEIDCTVSLPNYLLPAGASVRLHEHARAGDISVTDNKITTCSGDLSFNPQRGGVTYLCDGACANGTVIDAVAHAGYDTTWGGTPAMRFGTTFASPLSGILDATQDTARFVRIATQGTAPTFRAADWVLAKRSLYASFENGVKVQIQTAAEANWDSLSGQSAEVGTDASNAAVGSVALRIEHTGSDGPTTTLRATLPAAVGNPRSVSYFARTESTSAAAGYFDLLTGSFHGMQVSFESTGLGAERENNVRTEVPFSTNTWYQVELRDIDYANRKFDFYVNRQLVAADVSFWSNANSLTELRLFSVSSGSTAFWDEIELWQ